MATYPLLLLGFALLSSGLGLVGIAWGRCVREPVRARWGRRLFLGTLGVLGLLSLLEAGQPHRGLIYVGLAVGALVIAMLWESRHDEARGGESVG